MSIKREAGKLLRGSQRNVSRSQAGEDRILSSLFDMMEIKKPSYIDIGANDPMYCNNTFLFYSRGSQGVVIEPDPSFGKKLRDKRPGDIIVQAAISDRKKEGTTDFYIFNVPALNTLSKEEADQRVKSGKFKLKKVIQIELVTIADIIKRYFSSSLPVFISLDIEGMDYDVLQAFDFTTYPVPIWIVETCEYSENHIKPKVHSIIDLMLSKGYFIYADTYINTIFVHKEWFQQKGKK